MLAPSLVPLDTGIEGYSPYPDVCRPARGVLSKSHISPSNLTRRLRIEATYPSRTTNPRNDKETTQPRAPHRTTHPPTPGRPPPTRPRNHNTQGGGPRPRNPNPPHQGPAPGQTRNLMAPGGHCPSVRVAHLAARNANPTSDDLRFSLGQRHADSVHLATSTTALRYASSHERAGRCHHRS